MTPDSKHLSTDEVAGYAEQRLSAEEYAMVETHLAECADCRRDAVAVGLALGRERRRRRWLVGGPIGALAAAAIAGLYVMGATRGVGTLDDQLRPGDPREGVASIAAWSPLPEQAVRRDALRFVWGADGSGALYRLTVTDGAGATLWSGTTGDTVTTLPDSVRFAPDGRYHWYVDVLLSDGTRATTGLREFRISP